MAIFKYKLVFNHTMANIKDAIKLYLEENPKEMPKTEDLLPPMATRLIL